MQQEKEALDVGFVGFTLEMAPKKTKPTGFDRFRYSDPVVMFYTVLDSQAAMVREKATTALLLRDVCTAGVEDT